MNKLTFLQIQTVELNRLLEKSAGDPILEPQLRDRLDEAQRELKAAGRQPDSLLPKESPTLPRAAIFLRGGGVQEGVGIRPILAAEALTQYEKMFVAQAIHDERIAAKSAGRQRRPRGAGTPSLLFTGTPRGSFGMEFVPQFSEDESLLDVHSHSLVNVADALTKVVHSGPEALDKIVDEIPAPVLRPLKQFLKVLSQHGAELRLAFHDRRSQSLTAAELHRAADFLDREIEESDDTIDGIFRGLTGDSGCFDFQKTSDDKTITGDLGDELTEGDMERIVRLFNQKCTAKVHKTTMRKLDNTTSTKYVLIDVRGEPSSLATGTPAD